jgi:DNA-binding transcriptional LysR family regulator
LRLSYDCDNSCAWPVNRVWIYGRAKVPMSMDWDKLKVFHAAAEAGSFTHAGEQLGLSQSAVSRQVSALEQELGVSLFHRHARGLILTEQGELLNHTAHDVFMQLEAARAKLTDSRERPNRRPRRFQSPSSWATWILSRLVSSPVSTGRAETSLALPP